MFMLYIKSMLQCISENEYITIKKRQLLVFALQIKITVIERIGSGCSLGREGNSCVCI